ncbi:hypothetical protein [Aquimarina algicola]|uniref:Uncharacterized protein n=1 Tax=Aquimarina algicola TaxID=2589995 RepID=A0A504JCN4_9FLAO|nr:hypothetical protein [Aquimarina algicola]TPN86205.1 hypothetical protein FHK87_13120 [Aquimarina algicola]
MKKIQTLLSKILDNPFVNLLVSIGLISIGIEELYDKGYAELNLHWKHGISIYGIFLCIEALFKIIKGTNKIYQHGKRIRNK